MDTSHHKRPQSMGIAASRLKSKPGNCSLMGLNVVVVQFPLYYSLFPLSLSLSHSLSHTQTHTLTQSCFHDF